MNTPPTAQRVVYLDSAATTPVRREVREAMEPFLSEGNFGNPSSTHRLGRAAREAVEQARRRIAEVIGVEPGDVLFTSGGTEADNLAVLGTALAARSAGRPFAVAVSAIEHKAVLASAKAVERLGGEAIILPVGDTGQVDLDAVGAALEQGVALLSVMWVNNEVGIVQDIPELARRAAAANTPFHTDAVQALGKVPCSIADQPISLLCLSGHKMGAPKGIGALIARSRQMLEPLLHGGGQELGIRPGTENVPGAIGLAAAAQLAAAELDATAVTTRQLRDELERRLLAEVGDAQVNGAGGTRAPHVSNISIPGANSETLLMQLDLAGIACSSGAACDTGSAIPSHVLTAMGLPPELAAASVRFSFSKDNTLDDVARVVEVMPHAVERVRKLSAALEGR
ncbi:MAG: aminotransferase class V-fold PLP-dependent enzyme [Gemmatimonadales bacterium]|nr:aminotransferase class V-fold PLP-dependent enzyme [Gemmatimonadales bacterium]NIN11291.1 aminotransferase class V-fold PLP-dependent enzyme [Gemmatimonadales bacterium]NIN49890.1 aminotransferase class V-fold PLP-dependent enzyme [Gemmatimonadales bacterium]NIP07354.1 aminotransferase class V-fold PLP-dependent enzyme [Gemmatimonadales bacterium]NIR03049.1 aminotransferase class V-fold PLP-dependent enzyme [Gemmatimonadales bacterium]